MKVVDDLNQEDQSRLEALIITGNGRSEYRRLKPLTSHYDEDRVLFLPSRTERHISVIGSTSGYPDTERRGWEALDAISLYKSKYGYTNFLFLVDNEHCSENGREELEVKIEELASSDSIDIEELNDGAFISEFKIGSRDIQLYTAVVGNEFGFFEDCLGELLELEWGNSIDAEDKDEFKSTINQILSGGSGRSLLDGAGRTNLDQAFPNLSSILQQFED